MSRNGQKQIHLFLSEMDVAVLVDMENRFGLNRSESSAAWYGQPMAMGPC
ncbi:MAG: hypothetical protein HC855_11875 [Rhizobiales bacterium]|nr:hypothetical protein [Hyphomicrobiales bacterium]